jgi:regulator of sirC expression with transglutaminase-like and TPR domain
MCKCLTALTELIPQYFLNRSHGLDLTEHIDKGFLQLASLSDDRINLAHSALLFAKAAYPDLNESVYLARLDRLAADVKRDLTADPDAVDIIARMNDILFDKERFRGNREQYYDPDNSYLNRVLDRKTGIPISLCLIYIEVAGRLGLDVRGIGLPGHFIAALYHTGGKIYIDPFNQGQILSKDDCLEIVRTYSGETAQPDLGWLQPIGRKALVARMLRNLKLIYARQENDVMLFKMVHWILKLQPDSPLELSERALLYEEMGNPTRAAIDWERCLANINDHQGVKKIRARIDVLKKMQSRIH